MSLRVTQSQESGPYSGSAAQAGGIVIKKTKTKQKKIVAVPAPPVEPLNSALRQGVF